MSLIQRAAAEFIGTFWLVLAGCGAALLSSGVPDVGVGWTGVSLAFGLTVLTMAYAIGHVSGCHLNPAVSAGLALGGRFKTADVVPYAVAQLAGGFVGALVLYVIARGHAEFDLAGGFASNGFGEDSPGGYPLASVFLTEVVMTFVFGGVLGALAYRWLGGQRPPFTTGRAGPLEKAPRLEGPVR